MSNADELNSDQQFQDIAARYAALDPGRKNTLLTASKADIRLFTQIAALCGFNESCLESLRKAMSPVAPPKPTQTETDWGNSLVPPHGTPGKIRPYWSTVKNPSDLVKAHRRFMGSLLSELQWGKKREHAKYFNKRVRKWKSITKELIQAKIDFYKSPAITAAHELDIDALRTSIIAQKRNKKNNNNRTLKLVSSNRICGVDAANKILATLSDLLIQLETEITSELKIGQKNDFAAGGYVNKARTRLGGGTQPRAPTVFKYYIKLVKDALSLKNVIIKCKEEIMTVNYNMIGLNQSSLKSRSEKYDEHKKNDKDRKAKDRAKQKKGTSDNNDSNKKKKVIKKNNKPTVLDYFNRIKNKNTIQSDEEMMDLSMVPEPMFWAKPGGKYRDEVLRKMELVALILYYYFSLYDRIIIETTETANIMCVSTKFIDSFNYFVYSYMNYEYYSKYLQSKTNQNYMPFKLKHWEDLESMDIFAPLWEYGTRKEWKAYVNADLSRYIQTIIDYIIATVPVRKISVHDVALRVSKEYNIKLELVQLKKGKFSEAIKKINEIYFDIIS